jgi:perosamine synthetase
MKVQRARPIVGDEEIEAAKRVLLSGMYILGPELKDFENKFASYCKAKYAVGVNSGTSALILTLMALNLKKNDEVITAPNSFVATGNAIVLAGAKPVFVDIDPETYTINTDLLERAINKNTKAIIPVHLFGHPADMEPIIDIAKDKEITTIEDAAQAHGAEYKGKLIGNIGDVTCFSFFPTKNMTVGGDGGMILTKNEEIYRKCFMLRDAGRWDSKSRSEIFGYNMRLNEISAAIGKEQLKKLDGWNEKRRQIARIYTKNLQDIVKTPVEKEWAKHIYHLYVIRNNRRDELKKFLNENGIETGIHYPIPIHLQPPFLKLGFKNGLFPITERYANLILSLPMSPAMNKNDVEYISSKIIEFHKK